GASPREIGRREPDGTATVAAQGRAKNRIGESANQGRLASAGPGADNGNGSSVAAPPIGNRRPRDGVTPLLARSRFPCDTVLSTASKETTMRSVRTISLLAGVLALALGSTALACSGDQTKVSGTFDASGRCVLNGAWDAKGAAIANTKGMVLES